MLLQRPARRADARPSATSAATSSSHGGVDAVAATATPGGIGAIRDRQLPGRSDAQPRGPPRRRPPARRGRPALIRCAGLRDHRRSSRRLTAKAQGVEVRRGDSLLIRTGWGQYFGKDNAKFPASSRPARVRTAARWIIDQGAAGRRRHRHVREASGRVRPELFSVHTDAAGRQRHLIVENANLEPLGDAANGVALLIMTPLKIQGGTGSLLARARAGAQEHGAPENLASPSVGASRRSRAASLVRARLRGSRQWPPMPSAFGAPRHSRRSSEVHAPPLKRPATRHAPWPSSSRRARSFGSGRPLECSAPMWLGAGAT